MSSGCFFLRAWIGRLLNHSFKDVTLLTPVDLCWERSQSSEHHAPPKCTKRKCEALLCELACVVLEQEWPYGGRAFAVLRRVYRFM
jgi:hypothetical protein